MRSEVEEFLKATLERYVEAERAIHEGDAGPRLAMWSRQEPVTLFGAAFTKSGWTEVAPVFDFLASTFSDCSSYENEVVAVEASGDLAYMVALEHSNVSINGEPRAYTLRVTTVFRREDGEWKIVHRHGDSLASESPTAVVDALHAAARSPLAGR